ERWRGSKGKRIRAGWIRTAGQRQLLTAATTSCELRFGRASTSWKAYQVYFQMDPATCPYLFWSGRNWARPRVGARPYGRSSPLFIPLVAAKNRRVLMIEIASCYRLAARVLAKPPDECPRGRVDAHHKFAATIGDGVSVAKAQRLWTVVVGP
ncbi:hypothetical protein PIB30_111577, partial [Stylosanthes scabra]|nr:hypothetical protein [Stylosanthes scabra]